MINAYETLKNFAYVRTGGSPEELKAAEYLKSKFEEIGLKAKLESFKVQASEIESCSLIITKPYKKEIKCLPYTGSGVTDGLTKDLYFIRNLNSDYELSQVKDKIVIVQGYLRMWSYKDLVEHGAAGIIVSDGYHYVDNKDIDQREMRDQLREFGTLPVVQINTKDLFEMIQSGASQATMVTVQKEIKGTSHNVVATIKGEVEDTIVFTGHYDSTSLSTGAWDNGTGSVTVLKLAEHFANKKPKYTTTFILCGSEERGLLGSHAYVKKHEKTLDKIKFCINIDMVGSLIANLICCVTAEEACVGYTDYFAKIYGKSLHVYQDVYSSDSTPFADKGIPAISFGSYSMVTPIHNRYDTMDIVNEELLDKDIEFIVAYSEQIANAALLPVKRTMPDNMKEKLDLYLGRKRK